VRTSSRKGFTLIELIIVIVVLGILAGIAIAGYTAVIRRSNISSVEQSATSFNREILNLAAQKAAQSGTQSGLATDKTTRDGNLLWEALQAGDGPKGVVMMGLIFNGVSQQVEPAVIWDGSAVPTGLISPAGNSTATRIYSEQYYLQFVKNGASICMRLSNTGAQAYDKTDGGTPTGDRVSAAMISDNPTYITGVGGTPLATIEEHAGWLIMRRVASGSGPTTAAPNACDPYGNMGMFAVEDDNTSATYHTTLNQDW
jgi:prepilin-type N-terminal cleavage/methylation domain-containing protein